MGQKPSDWRAISLCKHHHSQQHTVGEDTFWQNYAAASGETVDDLIDQFCKASPVAREIREARNV